MHCSAIPASRSIPCSTGSRASCCPRQSARDRLRRRHRPAAVALRQPPARRRNPDLVRAPLAEAGLSPEAIPGSGTEEFTHQAVAALIATGSADVGMGTPGVRSGSGSASTLWAGRPTSSRSAGPGRGRASRPPRFEFHCRINGLRYAPAPPRRDRAGCWHDARLRGPRSRLPERGVRIEGQDVARLTAVTASPSSTSGRRSR